MVALFWRNDQLRAAYALARYQGAPTLSSLGPDLVPAVPHAGAGGARSRAISDRMSTNICRETATSAIWNAT